MKKTFLSAINFLQKDLVFFITMCIIMLSYGLTGILDLILAAALFILLLANINNNKLFYGYFACIFFEPILVLPLVGGTFFRLFYVLMFIRVVIDIVKRKKYKFDIPTIILGGNISLEIA